MQEKVNNVKTQTYSCLPLSKFTTAVLTKASKSDLCLSYNSDPVQYSKQITKYIIEIVTAVIY